MQPWRSRFPRGTGAVVGGRSRGVKKPTAHSRSVSRVLRPRQRVEGRGGTGVTARDGRCATRRQKRQAQRAEGKTMRRLRVLLVLSLVLRVHAAVADDATVLPQGVWWASVEARFSLPITRQFTPSGGTEPLAVDFNNALNSTIFPDLQRVEAAFRLPPGSATFGRSVVDFTRHIQLYTVYAAYGLTDRLSVGLRLPYWAQQTTVKATLDARTATVGFNPAVPGGVAPLQVPGTRPPTTEDIQAAVERLGFRRVTDWSDASVSDLFGGLKYQYYQSAHWRLAVTGRVRFPTGRWDDPHNLVDYPTGYGAWGLGIQLHQDFVWSTRTTARLARTRGRCAPHHLPV